MDDEITTPQEIGARLRNARSEAGMTLDDVIFEFRLRNIPASMRMSRGKINQLEKGHSAHPDPWDLLLLATIYRKELADISVQAADDIDRYRRFVVVSGDNGGGTPGSPCTPTLLVDAA